MIDKATVTFTPANWNTHQTVTVTGVNDNLIDGNQTSTITISVNDANSDDIFDSLANKIVNVITQDNDCPEINTKGNNKNIIDGDTTPDVADYTNFGNVDIAGETVTRTFIIENTGLVDLTLLGTPEVSIGGANVEDFTVVSQPSTSIPVGGTTTFEVKFDPSVTGERTAEVSIQNNDSDENPYNFTIKGIGTTDTQAPTVTSYSPSNEATNIAINSNLELTFNENIVKGIGNITIYKGNDESLVETIPVNETSISENVVTINPSNNLEKGTEYYVLIENSVFKDHADNSFVGIDDKTTWKFTTIQKKSKKSDGNSGTTTTPIGVEVNGQEQETMGEAQTKTQNGQTITTVKIDKQELEEKLNKEGQKATVTIPIQAQSGTVVGQLNGQMVKNMEQKETIVEIKTGKATYTLPAQQINIEQVSQQLGEKVELKDIKVEIEIGETPNEMVKVVENAAKKDEFTLVVPPVDFTVKCSYKDKTVEIKGFSDYVERTIAIPEGVDHTKITTGLIVYPDGTSCHVPTQIIEIVGKYYAKINSLTNSTYTVIWNPKEYKDVEGHWGKEICNEMGAKMVVVGETETMFSPNKQVSRLFFTQTVVRALGLGEKGTQCTFKDVDKSKDYFGAVATSVEYNLISGYEDNTFRANNNITREEAAALIVRAMKIAGLKIDYTEEELQQELDKFVDKEKISIWAKEYVAICAKNGMIIGNEKGEFTPKENMTKAQLAAIMMRMLENADLI